VDTDQSGKLDFDEFIYLLREMRTRPELIQLFRKYSSNGESLTAPELLQFLQEEQEVSGK